MRVATQGGIGFVGQWVCDDGFARSDPHLCAITEGDLISLPCVGSGELAMLFYLIAAPLFLLGVRLCGASFGRKLVSRPVAFTVLLLALGMASFGWAMSRAVLTFT